jgi:hypothetical protein
MYGPTHPPSIFNVCGRVRVTFVGGDEISMDWVLVDVGAAGVEVFCVADAVIGKASLPDGNFGGEAVGKASFDELHGAFERDGLRGDEEMDMVGHDDEGVEEIVLFGTVALESFEEKVGVAGDLEDAAAIVG